MTTETTQQLISVLKQAIEIAEQNDSDYFDLDTFIQVIDRYIDKLKENIN